MKLPAQGVRSDAEIAASARVVRVAVWGQALGYLLFSITDLAVNAAGVLGEDALASLALPGVAVLLMHTSRFDVVLAVTVGRRLLCFMALLVSLSAAALPWLGAWVLKAPLNRFGIDADLLTTNALLTLALFYSGALLLNIYYVVLAWRAAGPTVQNPPD